MSTRFIPTISRGWLMEEVYGWRQAPSIAACRVPYLYAKAMLFAAGAGSATTGTQRKREYVAGMLGAHFAGAADADLLQFVNYFDRTAQPDPPSFEAARTGLRKGVRRGLPGVNARVIVYDAVRTATATGALSTSAAADVAAVASELGVSAIAAKRIATLCDREASLELRRRKLLMGDEATPIA
jgi:hypothetical protein